MDPFFDRLYKLWGLTSKLGHLIGDKLSLFNIITVNNIGLNVNAPV